MRPWSYLLLLMIAAALSVGQATIKTRKQELEKIKEDLARTRSELANLQKKEVSILVRLEALDQERILVNRLIDALRIQEEEYNSAINHTNLEIKATESAINNKKETLKHRIVRIYQQTQFHELEMYLSSRSIPEVLAASYYLRYIASDDRRAFEDFKKLHKTYLYQKDNYETLLEELQQTKQERETELSTLHSQQKAEKSILDSVRYEAIEKKQLERDLKQAQRRLEDLIVSFEKSRTKETGKIHQFETVKGTMPWPCRGRVINTFGKIRHPKYNTVTKNNGIDIQALIGSDVFAIGPGRVAYADRFLGYGTLIIIDHNDGYYTLYGHLSEMLVQVGANVASGQKIGEIGDVGSLGEAMLHFEMRKKGKPVDPLAYLK